MSDETAFTTTSFHTLKWSNHIGQFHILPVACVGFSFISNKADFDFTLDVQAIPGEFPQNRLYGRETHVHQIKKETQRCIDILVYR